MKRVDEEPTAEAIGNALTADPLHRRSEIDDFLKMLIAVEPPYTFVIDAPWGSGKTFFIKQVARVLQMANPVLDQDLETLSATLGEAAKELPKTPCLPIYFNAWEDDHFDNPVLPILATIANTAGEQSVKGGEDFRKGVIGVIETAVSFIGYSGNVNGVIENFSGTDFLAQYKNEKELRSKIDELLKNYLPGIADRAIVFIDELDRCRPEFAIKVLEQTKTLFQQENVVVVYSADITQLAHSLQGVYGPSFEGRKYLERFYDKRLELNPIKPADYLLYKGVSSHDGYTDSFILITNELLSSKRASLRTCNRLVNPIKEQLDYINNHQGVYGNGRARLFPNLCLLPALNVLAHFEPLAWYEVKTIANFSTVYELAKHSKHFIQCLDIVIEEVWGSKKDELPYKQDIETRRERFVEDVCALIFVNDYRDPRIEELSNSELTYTNFNQELWRRLTPPSND